jgi:hypothetical protein
MKKKKERRVYLPRVLGSGQVMMPADVSAPTAGIRGPGAGTCHDRAAGHGHWNQRSGLPLGSAHSVPLHVRRGIEWVIHATGTVVGRGARHEFLQGVSRLAPSGKDIRDGFYGRRSHLSKFYIASRLSLNSLPLSFEKISCFVQLPDKLFDLRNRWSANLLNKWRDIRIGLGRRRRLWVN